MQVSSNRYYVFNLITIVCISALFLLGGLVRATGSGMGCPDWPMCFGKLAPPLSEDLLPGNYREIFLEKRKEKIDRYIAFLNKVGLKERAIAIQNSPDLLKAHDFNVVKAYIEYVNRLFSVVTGLFLAVTIILSFGFIKTDILIPVYSILALIMVLINGWLGSIVVDTNLLSGMVSIHFILAFASICFLILAYHSKKTYPAVKVKYSGWMIYIGLLLIVIQLFSGLNTRALIESTFGDTKVISLDKFLALGSGFAFHRYFSITILAIFGWLAYTLYKQKETGLFTGQILWITIIVIAQIATGALNITHSFPLAAQVLHITLGALLFIVAFNAFTIYRNSFV